MNLPLETRFTCWVELSIIERLIFKRSIIDNMALVSIEIDRRAYEFMQQHILNDKEIRGTSNSCRMMGMFYGCNALKKLDLSGWDTSNVKYMDGMFYRCENLTHIDLSGWGTSSVENMEHIVSGATIDGDETCTSFKQALYFREIGFRLYDTMIWEKSGMPPTKKHYYNIFEYMFVFLQRETIKDDKPHCG